ncbi:uncharacterized protein LOC144158259 isoform X2 [Haemaphysalis longicornis]
MSTDGVCSRDAFCSRMTQAIITTSATGTQCALIFPISASCQTEEEFSGTCRESCEEFPVDFLETVLEEGNNQAGALERFPASQDNADIVAKAGPHMCSCNLHSSYTGCFDASTETRGCQPVYHGTEPATLSSTTCVERRSSFSLRTAGIAALVLC